MKIIIAGSRGFDDYETLCRVCDHMLQNQKIVEIVSGAARGADRLGEQYAMDRGYPVRLFSANWDEFGNAAGYIRNEEMARYADALIAFWDGISRGTDHMINLAKKYDLKIKIHRF